MICGAHGGYETAEVRDLRRTGGEPGLRDGGRKKSGGGVSWTTSEMETYLVATGRMATLQ